MIWDYNINRMTTMIRVYNASTHTIYKCPCKAFIRWLRDNSNTDSISIPSEWDTIQNTDAYYHYDKIDIEDDLNYILTNLENGETPTQKYLNP